jgi:hypothetical protein
VNHAREAKVQRDRLEDLAEGLDRLTHAAPAGASCIVATTVMTTYPTAAAAYYAVQEFAPGGPEVEGGPATETPVGAPFLAWNRGGSVPVQGYGYLIADEVGGRWTIDYNG